MLLRELPLASQLQVSLNPLSLLVLESLSLSGLSLTFFESTLGSESINFSLSISSLLLELSQPLDRSFFLILDSLGLKLSFILLLVLSLLVLDYLFFVGLLLSDPLLFLKGGLSVGLSSFLHEHIDSLSFLLLLILVLLLHFANVLEELEPLLVADFLLLHALHGPLLALVDDDLGALLAGLSLLGFALLLFLQHLEPLDLHHEVQLLLLGDPLLLQHLVLFELLVADGHHLGVEHHLVHVLDVVELLVQLLLSLAEKGFGLLPLALLVLGGLDLGGPLLVHLQHSLFARLALGEGCIFLLLDQLLLL